RYRKTWINWRRNMPNVAQQSGRVWKPTLSSRREAASFNKALHLTAAALGVMIVTDIITSPASVMSHSGGCGYWVVRHGGSRLATGECRAQRNELFHLQIRYENISSLVRRLPAPLDASSGCGG